MANYFQLVPINGTKPENLSLIDERICKEVFQCEPHPEWWGSGVLDWYNCIVFMLSEGKSLHEGENSVREYCRNNNLWAEELPLIEKVIDFLQENYTVKCWRTW